MKCECGNNVTTPFCPQCGMPTNNPLLGLLSYVRSQKNSAVRNFNNRMKFESENYPNSPKADVPKKVLRWSEWEYALLQSIGEDHAPSAKPDD